MSDVENVGPRLLASLGVDTIVYVDDLFGIDEDRLHSTLLYIDNKDLSKACAILAVDNDVDDLDVLRARLKDAIKNIQPDHYKSIHRDLSELGEDEEEKRDYATAQALQDALGPEVTYHFLSHADWIRRSDELLATENAQSTLFLFDEDFSREGKAEELGRALIETTHASLEQAVSCIALLTHKVADDASEETLRQEIVSQQTALRDALVVIRKNRLLDEDGEVFSSKLKVALLSRRFDALNRMVHEALKSAQQAARDQVDLFTIEQYEQIVVKTSADEGAWVPETLMRLFSIVCAKRARESLRTNEDVHRLVNDTHRVCDVSTRTVSKACERAALLLQHAERYDADQDINPLHLEVWLGDVFQASGGKRFLLLGQPCEMMVRSNGLRSQSEKQDSRQMATLVAVKKQEKKKELNSVWEEIKLYDKDGSFTWYADFTRLCHIPLWLLDLAALNGGGECQLQVGQVLPKILVPSWQRRLTRLQSYAENVVKQWRLINQGDGDASQFADALARLPVGSPFKINISAPETDEWKVAVSLRRVDRLREPYAAAMLTRLGAHITRAAFPHDLTVRPH